MAIWISSPLARIADSTVRRLGDPRRVVATSKTFKQLARLSGAAPQRKGSFVHRELARRDVRAWTPRLATMCASERAKLRGVSDPRSRQILAGAVLAELTMATLDIESLEVCPWALREGMVLRHLESMTYSPPFSLQPVQRTTTHGVAGLRRRPNRGTLGSVISLAVRDSSTPQDLVLSKSSRLGNNCREVNPAAGSGNGIPPPPEEI